MEEQMKKLIDAKNELIKLITHINELENEQLSHSHTMTQEEMEAKIIESIEKSCEPLKVGCFGDMEIDAIKSFVINVMVEMFAKRESK